MRKSHGQNQNSSLPSPFNLRPPFAFTLQLCSITPDDNLSESLRPPIYPSDPLQRCLRGCLHLAEPKSSFLLTSLFKFLSHWAAGYSSGTKHSPHEQTFLPICVQQPQQKRLPLLPMPPIIFSTDLTTHLTSFPTPSLLSKTRLGLFVQSLGLFIYLQTFILPVLLVKSVWGQPLSVFSHEWQDCG